MKNKMFEPLRDLLLDRIENVEAIPAALGADPVIGKHLVMAGEYLEADELVELYEVIGLSGEQRNGCISSFTLTAFRSLNKA